MTWYAIGVLSGVAVQGLRIQSFVADFCLTTTNYCLATTRALPLLCVVTAIPLDIQVLLAQCRKCPINSIGNLEYHTKPPFKLATISQL